MHVAAAVGLLMLTALSCALFAALASALVAPSLSRRVAAWAPASRHRALFAIAMGPTTLALTLFLAAVWRAVISLAIPSLDHCALHDDAHAHLCFVHLPEHAMHPLVAVALALLGGLLSLALVASVRRVTTSLALVRSLRRTGTRDAALGATVVETDLPVCVTAGLLRPETILSVGFLREVGAAHREVVLAHERAHARRRDAMFGVVARFASGLHRPAFRGELLDELGVAAEEACDEQAAVSSDARVDVAEAILAVERSFTKYSGDALGAAVVAFGESAVTRRVETLLAPPGRAGSLRAALALSVCVAIGLAVVSPYVHHLAESVLSHVVE